MSAGIQYVHCKESDDLQFFCVMALRSAPQLSADSGQFDAHSMQSVFCRTHVAAENESYSFFDMLNRARFSGRG